MRRFYSCPAYARETYLAGALLRADSRRPTHTQREPRYNGANAAFNRVAILRITARVKAIRWEFYALGADRGVSGAWAMHPCGGLVEVGGRQGCGLRANGEVVRGQRGILLRWVERLRGGVDMSGATRRSTGILDWI